MKYLKSFNESYSETDSKISAIEMQDIIEYSYDILVDLKDDNFVVGIEEALIDNTSQSIGFTIANSVKFTISDINDYLERLTSYLKTEGFIEHEKVMYDIDYLDRHFTFMNVSFNGAYFYCFRFQRFI